MNGDGVHFFTDNQKVFLRLRGEKTEASPHLSGLAALAVLVSPAWQARARLLPVSASRINRQELKVS